MMQDSDDKRRVDSANLGQRYDRVRVIALWTVARFYPQAR